MNFTKKLQSQPTDVIEAMLDDVRTTIEGYFYSTTLPLQTLTFQKRSNGALAVPTPAGKAQLLKQHCAPNAACLTLQLTVLLSEGSEA